MFGWYKYNAVLFLQVGLWDGEVRHGFLKKEYSFQCHCSACSKFNLSDIVLGAFHCTSPDCSGVVLDIRVAEWLKKKINYFPSCEKVSCLVVLVNTNVV